MNRKNLLKKLLFTLAFIFIFMNVIAFFHAYKFTHYTRENIVKTNSMQLSTLDKLGIVFFGINNPRPENKSLPKQNFEVVKLQSNKHLEGWFIKADSAKGTIILFHGYGGEKSSMLDRSDELNHVGYNILLVDFMGSGGSEGLQTTIGYKEAEEVKTCYDYLKTIREKNIYLLGTSMGAVAIMKAMQDYDISPTGIILECPFGSMYQATCARFKIVKVPTFPMAGLLVFWGGIQNGFWAFGHNPTEYAKAIKCNTLLIYGEHDPKVSKSEIDEIYANLNGKKVLNTFPLAGHADYLTNYRKEWIQDIQNFLLTAQPFAQVSSER